MDHDNDLETPETEPGRLFSGPEFALTVVLLFVFIGVRTALALHV